jgi:monoterpene epsilon-lactone hydrolase
MTRQQRDALDLMLRQSPAGSTPQTVDAQSVDTLSVDAQSVSEMRTGFAALMATMAVPTGIRKSPTVVGTVPAVRVDPLEGARRGTILYFHGGSFALGSPETAIGLTANLVTRTGVSAVSLDYRLAPEHPFPAAIHDGLAAFRGLLESGIDPESIVFAGDSAGGGLCVTTCLVARAAGLPMPAAIVAFSPGLDAARNGASMATKAGIDPFFTREGLAGTAAMYLAGEDPNQELLSPATLADLTGLPPILLQVGTNEVLLDDSTRLAERARDAGVDVILDITANVPHVFPSFVGVIDEAGQALDRAALFITQHLA